MTDFKIDREWLERTTARADMLGVKYRKLECNGGYAYILRFEDETLVDFYTNISRKNTKHIVYLDEEVTDLYISDGVFMLLDCPLVDAIHNIHDTIEVHGGGERLQSIYGMFKGCKLNKVDLSNLSTPNLKNMSCLFQFSEIDTVYYGNIDVTHVSVVSSMFCESEINNMDFENLKFNKSIFKYYKTYSDIFKKFKYTGLLNLNHLNIDFDKLAYKYAVDAELGTVDISLIDLKCSTYRLCRIFNSIKSVNKLIINEKQREYVDTYTLQHNLGWEICLVK